MLKDISRGRLAGMWAGAVAVMAALSVFWGMAVTVSNAELWLLACLVPPVVILFLWPGAAPATVGQMLHSPEPAKDDRP